MSDHKRAANSRARHQAYIDSLPYRPPSQSKAELRAVLTKAVENTAELSALAHGKTRSDPRIESGEGGASI